MHGCTDTLGDCATGRRRAAGGRGSGGGTPRAAACAARSPRRTCRCYRSRCAALRRAGARCRRAARATLGGRAGRGRVRRRGDPAAGLPDDDPEPVPLARLDPGSARAGELQRPGRPRAIVLYRRPLMARADDEEDLSELVLDVVVEEFARLLGVDPQAVDPGYPGRRTRPPGTGRSGAAVSGPSSPVGSGTQGSALDTGSMDLQRDARPVAGDDPPGVDRAEPASGVITTANGEPRACPAYRRGAGPRRSCPPRTCTSWVCRVAWPG